jgi:hypothetical protein
MDGLASQVRHSPKHAIFPPNQVSAHMMQSRRVSRTDAAYYAILCRFMSGERRVHFDMIEKRRAVSYHALTVQHVSEDREGPRCPFCIQEQKERKEQWNVVCHGCQRLAGDLFFRRRIWRCHLVVLQPTRVELESNPLEQFSDSRFAEIRDAGVFAAKHPARVHSMSKSLVKIDVSLDGRNLRFVSSGRRGNAPKRARHTRAPAGTGS